MRLLKITLVAVGLLVVLKIAEIILSKYSPFTILFHQSVIKSLQLLVLAWLILAIILSLILRKHPGRAVRIATLAVLFVSLVFEILFGYLLQHPGKIPSALVSPFQQYYSSNYRKVIQVESNCSEFDSAFFYRLRRNVQCDFSNIEFSSLIETNSAGLRDDENSLMAPDVICIGDSYTMGWGVQQQESFPQQVEHLTKMKVLNAGISSFGTVRELRKFFSLDTSNCKWVILQYCDNDAEETNPFVKNHFTLKTSSEQAYESLRRKYEWNRVYYPGKTFLSVGGYILKDFVRKLKKIDTSIVSSTNPIKMSETVNLFAQTLFHFNIPLENRKLIILYANEKRYPDERFTNGLQQLLQTAPYRDSLQNKIFLLNTSDILTENDRYKLDDHFTKTGHLKIAQAIKKIIDANP